jgi:hypothetical protein
MTASGGRDDLPPRRTLYGRSRGKALRAGQERLLAEALPRFSIAPDALAGGSAFAAPPREIWLEIGFGAGEHLIAQAKANPDVGVVGCEPFLNGVVAALAGVELERLANVRLRRGDAQGLIEAVADGFFSRVFLLYPDPWPKRRHHKRRAVGAAMIEALARARAFSLRPISGGSRPEPTIGAGPGPNGARRAMRPRLVERAGGPFTSLSCGCEPKGG